jgi:hypothetical protein
VKTAIAAIALLLTFSVECSASSGCGTQNYENHNQIAYGPLRLTRPTGVAIDPTGVAVPNTCVYLFTEKKHRFVAKAEVDSDGEFNLKGIKEGAYRLVASSPGFCAANVPLIISGRATHNRVVVHLKVGGIDECSYGDYKRTAAAGEKSPLHSLGRELTSQNDKLGQSLR